MSATLKSYSPAIIRDNPICDYLLVGGPAVEQVDSFKYLATVVDKKLNSKTNARAGMKKTNFGPKMFLLAIVYFYKGVMYSCVKGA